MENRRPCVSLGGGSCTSGMRRHRPTRECGCQKRKNMQTGGEKQGGINVLADANNTAAVSSPFVRTDSCIFSRRNSATTYDTEVHIYIHGMAGEQRGASSTHRFWSLDTLFYAFSFRGLDTYSVPSYITCFVVGAHAPHCRMAN